MLITRFAHQYSAAVALLLASLLALGAGSAVASVAVKTIPGSDRAVTRVEISGTIERGDAQRVQAFLAGLPKGPRIVIELHSSGGSIEEALRLGRHIHASRIGTAVTGAGRECLSACALTFLAGRDTAGRADRVKGRQSQVGFHAFRRIVPDKEFMVTDMHEAIASTQQTLLAIADYLSAVDAGIEFMSMMLEKPWTSMTYLANDKAPALGVEIVD